MREMSRKCQQRRNGIGRSRGPLRIYGKKDSRYGCLVLALPLESEECRVSVVPRVCTVRRCAIAGEGQLASSRDEINESVVKVTSSRCSNDGNELNSANCSLNSSLGATTSRRVYCGGRVHNGSVPILDKVTDKVKMASAAWTGTEKLSGEETE